MYRILLATILFWSTAVYSQINIGPYGNIPLKYYLKSSDVKSDNGSYLFENKSVLKDTTVKKEAVTSTSKKNPGLAFLLSLAVPGLGQTYTKRFDVGKYFMISEAVLWMTYASFTVYGNWMLNDAYNFAVIHAGIDKNDKPDQFFLDIANYNNVDIYNNNMLQQGQYDKLYYPELGYGFYWDNVANRELYRTDKLAADNIKHDRIFVVGAVLLNHVISAISAIIVTNKYNSGLEKSSGGWTINAGVNQTLNRMDGLKLNFVKWF